MICKWCGAAMTGSERNCRRCGKEQPALSQCGGFYDLVPSARPAAAPAAKAPAQRKSSPLTAVLAIVCVILAAALVFVWLGSRELQEENQRLERRLEKLEGEEKDEADDQPGVWEDLSGDGSETELLPSAGQETAPQPDAAPEAEEETPAELSAAE